MNPPLPDRHPADFVVDGLHARGPGSTLYRVHAAEGRPDPGMPLLMKIAHVPGVHSEVEQQILPRLAGPHGPRFVAAGDPAGQPWLVMEHVPGRTLQDWLDAPPLPDSAEVLRLGVALAQAVHALHRQQIVHHDLQPAHVLMHADGRAVLLGLGCAWHAHLPDLLATGLPTAAPWHAPELLRGQRGDPRSDVYAMGVMLLQLLTGSTVPAALAQRQPPVTLWLLAVLRRCLAPAPAQRYPSAAHLAFDLLHPQAMHEPAAARSHGLQALWQRGRDGLRAAGLLAPPAPDRAGVPIVVLAVSPAATAQPLPSHLRRAVQRALGTHPLARLLCVTVLPAAGDGEAGVSRRWLARLRHWLRPLNPPGREAGCAVLLADEPVAALRDCVQQHFASELVLDADPAVALPEAQQLALASAVTCSVLLARP